MSGSISVSSNSWWVFLAGLSLICVRYGSRYGVFRWRLHRLKERVTVVAEYTAPPNIPAAFFGVLLDNRGSIQDLNATLLEQVRLGFIQMTYDLRKHDYLLELNQEPPQPVTFGHQQFVLDVIAHSGSIWAKDLGSQEVQLINEYSFRLHQDLQEAGYYHLSPYLKSASIFAYYASVYGSALKAGLRKPINWLTLILCLFQPILFPVWLFIGIVFYNRLGLYPKRTALWEEQWPEMMGYYNYLRTVEAPKRSFRLAESPVIHLHEHDPYLVAALLQPMWSHIFVGVAEVGAGGNEYQAG